MQRKEDGIERENLIYAGISFSLFRFLQVIYCNFFTVQRGLSKRHSLDPTSFSYTELSRRPLRITRNSSSTRGQLIKNGIRVCTYNYNAGNI